MRLELFKTLWGDPRPWSSIIAEMRVAAFDGIEARIPDTARDAADKALLLRQEGVPVIAIALTGGGVIPRQGATLADHLSDLRHALGRAAVMQPRFVNVLGGNDRWCATQQADFINQAHEIGQSAGLRCVFETHRARILSSPWIARDVLRQCPDASFTLDISHWVVTCERLLDDPLDDFTAFLDRVHHIQARIGYDQGPQVPHPGAPEYAAALAFHQRVWAQVWAAQARRGYGITTLTPECGPDGYLHTLPFTNAPVADLWDLNRWIAETERRHFNAFQHASQET
ncbi:sugar phosphate isomerase/epimerase family protein [Gluconacetobacter sacchari]|uniref:Sugar phosphate isomerase/epimerase n=2 Tax=Gluconacetobacter sacchari TaxID=92759 RepID=A0A7W4IFT5_9PROT|nr:TIM barrel protein [Gluconacetobacter sacchari]MBB2162068.1 sugar phosphate isomerase/epimerase [Gluconacetobacter sacchari]GBQ22594.1 xylose isomerase [Gluconacetobacter sacchari DSM 12717]